MLMALLFKDSVPYRAEVADSSRYSMFVRFEQNGRPDGPVPEKHASDEPPSADQARGMPASFLDFDSLILHVDDNHFELPPCRFLPTPSGQMSEGWVVFEYGMPDIGQLLARKKLVLSDISFWNLSLILAQKDRIKPEFKALSSNLTFELSVCKQFFDDMERKFAREPEPVQEQLRQQLIDKEGRDFLEFFDTKVEELRELTVGTPREQQQGEGFFFRKQVWEYILHSQFLTRVNLKPRGYAGDYEMMQMIYTNEYAGGSVFSRLMHKYPLETDSAQAVRNRKTMIPQMLQAAYEDRQAKGPVHPFRVLSVACGSATELAAVFSHPECFDAFEFTLLDQDEEALAAARRNIRNIETGTGKKINVDYRAESVRILSRATYLARHPTKFHFIYSMGLFDYLIPQVGSIVFATLYSLLEPGGQLIIGNFHKDCPDRTFMDYWCDWVLYYRSKEEMLAFAGDCDATIKKVLLDSTGCQMFLQVTAPEAPGPRES